MKRPFLSSLSFLLSLFAGHSSSSAQDKKETNDAMFIQVQRLINNHQSDSLYDLLNPDFKAKFTNNAFVGVLNNNLYPLCPIQDHTFLNYADGISAYKATCKGTVLEFRIGVDNAGKIAHLRFLPYKEESAVKSYSVASSNPLLTSLDKQVDAKARPYISKSGTVGLCIGIIKDDATTIYGYGETIKKNKKIPDAFSVFEIGSATKTFTATLLAYYVSEHKVSLSDPVTKYLPAEAPDNPGLQSITLEMLSNHTSGLPRLPDNLMTATTNPLNPYKNYGEKDLLAYLKNAKPETPPGTQYAYSNLGAGLLGYVLERVSGKTYEQMVTDIICKPLGMTNTVQHLNTDQVQAAVYNERGDQVVMWDLDDVLAGAGALRSCAHDMLKYITANMNEDKRPLSKAISLTHQVTYSKERKVALGWHLDEIAGATYFWHNGGTGGSRSFVAFIPDKHIGVVVLSNCAQDVDDVGISILKALQ